MIWGEAAKELETRISYWERNKPREDSKVKTRETWRETHSSENKWKRYKRSRYMSTWEVWWRKMTTQNKINKRTVKASKFYHFTNI
jgi:hypothetical protein